LKMCSHGRIALQYPKRNLQKHSMPYVYKKSVLTANRIGLIEFGRSIRPSHLVTLNFHARYTTVNAEKVIGRWYAAVTRRLFRAIHQDPERRIDFVAYPEYTLADNIHYHAVARIPADYVGGFTRIGSERWKRLVPTSTFDVRPTTHDADSKSGLEDVLSYVTKSESAKDVLHSAMFHNLALHLT
jgi:hypothetical protein